MQLVWALVHASGLAVTSAADPPPAFDVFIQVNLVEHVGPHPQDERVAGIGFCPVSGRVVVLDAKADPGRTLLQSKPKVPGKRRKTGLGNSVYGGLVLPVVQVGPLNVVARHRGPGKRLQQQQKLKKQKKELLH